MSKTKKSSPPKTAAVRDHVLSATLTPREQRVLAAAPRSKKAGKKSR